MNSYYEGLTQLNEIEPEVLGKCNPEVIASFYLIRAKSVLYLSSEITKNEIGAVIMKKSIIVDLEECIKLCDRVNLYQQLREALYLKSLLCHSLSELYLQRDRQELWKEYNQMSESSAKEYNNVDEYIEETKDGVKIRVLEI